MLWFCKSVVSGAMYALNSSGPMTVPCGTLVVMVSTSDTPLFTRTTHVRSHKQDVSQARTLPDRLRLSYASNSSNPCTNRTSKITCSRDPS